MDINWTKHLKDPVEVERFKTYVKSSKLAFDHLIKLLEEKEAAINSEERSLSSYDNPNWAYRQAHRNGSREMLGFLKNLVDLDQQKGT